LLDVSRRITREQGSVYRLNGREVRARDVQILFADASTGSRSPSMVHQGRIGEIIQAKPEQRRRVLEEAAGISGLHARRHEAERRAELDRRLAQFEHDGEREQRLLADAQAALTRLAAEEETLAREAAATQSRRDAVDKRAAEAEAALVAAEQAGDQFKGRLAEL